MKITLIAAMGRRNRVIGTAGALPWSLPNDMAHFRQLTMAKPVLMGRKTFASIGRPLPGRDNIILSRDKTFRADGCRVFASADAVLNSIDAQELMVIGGAEIYKLFLPQADVMQLTLVEADIEGDAFFPEWDDSGWRIIKEESHQADDKHCYAYKFITLQRKK